MLKHVVLLATTGLLMGMLTSLVGLPPTVEPFVWLGSYALWVVFLVRAESDRPFTTVFVASILSGLIAGLTQLLLAQRYLRNNPWYADQMVDFEPALFVVQGLVAGLLFGLLIGGLCWAVMRRRAKQS